jgi:cytochrome c2
MRQFQSDSSRVRSWPFGLLAIAAVALIVGCPAPQSGPGQGDPNRGRELFVSKQCVTCHTLSGVPNAIGTVGPPLNGIGSAAATRKPGMTAAAYLRESIKDPNAFVPPGTTSPMILPGPVSDQEIDGVVASVLRKP